MNARVQRLHKAEQREAHHDALDDREVPNAIHHVRARMRNISILASSATVSENAVTRDAVVTIEGKGTFLIRCEKNPRANSCPLISCKVRRVEGGPE